MPGLLPATFAMLARWDGSHGVELRIGVGETRDQYHGPIVVPERPCQIALALPRDASVVVDAGDSRIEHNSQIVIGDGAIQFAPRQPFIAALEVGGG